MRHIVSIFHYTYFISVAVLALLLTACSSDDEPTAYDAYENWEQRNTAWFASILAEAEAGGDEWEVHTSLSQPLPSKDETISDDIKVVMRFIGPRCPEGERPLGNDSVRIDYRGWLMPATYRIDKRDTTYAACIDQSFYGAFAADQLTPFNDATAAPYLSCVDGFVAGFSTALQYMRQGEQAHIYIPANLGYGATNSSSSIPAYSTLHFFINLRYVYPLGTPVPSWK